MKARPTCQPRAHPRVLVSGVVVTNQMNLERGWHARLDMAQKRQELLVSMTRLALGEDTAIGDVEGGKQSGRTVTHVVVGNSLHIAQAHGQQGLRTLEGLDLTLLVDAQHKGVLGRVEVKPYHIADLLDEERIGRQLEAAAAVRLHAKQRQV